MVDSTVVESTTGVVLGLTEKEPIRILHVDDEPSFLKAAKQILEMQGAFHVEVALSVEEAIEKMKKKTYDAIVSGYMMPEKDGLEFLKELRDSGNTVPFIMFTGKGREEVAIRALNYGADQYVNKSGDPGTVYGELGHNIRQAVEKKRAEQEIRIKDDAITSSINAIAFADLEGNLTYVNRSFLRLWGYNDAKQVLAKSAIKSWQLEEKAAEVIEALRTRGSWMGELAAKKKDGSTFNAFLSASMVKDEAGKPVCMMGSLIDITERKKERARDISERKRIGEKLRESEERFRNLYESIPGSLAVYVGKEGHLMEYNEAFRKWTGYTDEELKGKTFLDFVHPDEQALAQNYYRIKRREEEYPLVWETRLVTKDGNIVPTQLRAAPYKREGRIIGTEVVNIDITKRKQAEQELKESEERFRNLYESIQDPVGIFVGREGLLIDYNKAFKKLCGYTDEELKNKIFLEFVHPDDQALVLEKYRTEYPEEELPLVYEIRGVNKKGEAIPLEISVSTYKKGGKVIGILVIHRDITERKKIQKERKKMEEKLRVVGGLTRHDVRNKLSAVTGNVYLVKQQLKGDDKALEYFEEAESAVRQVEEIFDFATTYEKLGMEKLVHMDVEKTVGEATSLSLDLQGVKVVNDCRGLTVLADSLLQQLFYNLIHNSLKHGEKVSQIRVHYKEAGKDQLKLVYEDDGVGLPKAEKEKIFKEGYGKGSGYGLYLIRKMCEVYGWSIQETGKQGKGAQFTVTIPKMDERGKMNYQL